MVDGAFGHLGSTPAASMAVALGERRPTGHSDGLAATVLPGGEWLVGGNWSNERAVIASLDGAGTVGGGCEHIAEVSFEQHSAELTFEPADVRLGPGSFEVTDTEPLTIEEIAAPMERLCW